MRDTKHEMILFSMYDRTGLQKHFEKLAAEGWMLEDIGNCFLRYRRSEPRQVHFCVSYYYKASAFDPYPTEEEQEFRDFCAHTGWEVAASNGKVLAFYNEREDPTPIETDPALEVDAIHKAMMRSTILAYAVCLLPSLLGLWISIGQLVNDPIGWLSRPSGLFSLLCWLVLLLLLGVELGGYFLWRRRALKAAEQGVFYPTPNHFPLQAVGLGVVAVALAGYLIDVILQSNPLMKLITLVMLGWVILLYLGVNGTRILLKRKGVSRGVNRAATLAVDVVLAFGLLAVIVFFTIRAAGSGLLDERRPAPVGGRPDGRGYGRLSHLDDRGRDRPAGAVRDPSARGLEPGRPGPRPALSGVRRHRGQAAPPLRLVQRQAVPRGRQVRGAVRLPLRGN